MVDVKDLPRFFWGAEAKLLTPQACPPSWEVRDLNQGFKGFSSSKWNHFVILI